MRRRVKTSKYLCIIRIDDNCDLEFDATMPDGTPRKLLDVSKMGKLGWKSMIDLYSRIKLTYDWYLKVDLKL